MQSEIDSLKDNTLEKQNSKPTERKTIKIENNSSNVKEIDEITKKDEELAKFKKFDKLIYKSIKSGYIDELLKGEDIFDYSDFSRFPEVTSFFHINGFVKLYEGNEYAKFTKSFLSFYEGYLKYIEEWN